MSTANETVPLLTASALTRRFDTRAGKGTLTAVDGVDLAVRRGEICAVVGESGSGKSTLGRMLIGLLGPTEGRVSFEGRNVGSFSRREEMAFRRRAQIVFQDPYSALDPRMRIGAQLREILDIHRIGTPAERPARVVEMLEQVGLDGSYARAMPSELSGGQRQRVCIAMALASDPEVIVADEPTSALDVSVQAQVLNLLADLQKRRNLTLVFITHDLGVVRHFCDRVAVMYLGRIVERAETAELFAAPRHPYTRALLSAIPEPSATRATEVELPEGEPPSPINPPSGCAFHPRCPRALDICKAQAPSLTTGQAGHATACHNPVPEAEAVP